MNTEIMSYVAGFLDGEGCFFIGSRRKAGIACENTYKPSIQMLKDLFGGSMTKVKGKKLNHRPTYRWCVV